MDRSFELLGVNVWRLSRLGESGDDAITSAAYTMTPSKVRARIVMLESMRLVFGRSNPDAGRSAPQRVYAVTAEGGRKAGISDAR